MKNKYILLIIGTISLLLGLFFVYLVTFVNAKEIMKVNYVELMGSLILAFVGYAFIKLYFDATRKAIKEDTLDGKMTIMED